MSLQLFSYLLPGKNSYSSFSSESISDCFFSPFRIPADLIPITVCTITMSSFFCLNDNPFQMIHLVENYLGCPSGEFLAVLLPATIQVFHLVVLISGRLTNIFQRKAAFLRFIRRILLQKDRIVHYQIHESDLIFRGCGHPAQRS